MKKITLLAVAALAISFASCKKDMTCECTLTPVSYTSGGVTVTTGLGDPSTTKTTMTKVSKKTATANCVSGEQTSTDSYVSGGKTITSVSVSKMACELK
jgi:hypothetical protein